MRPAALALLPGLLSAPALAGGLSAPIASPVVLAPAAPIAAAFADGDWTGPYLGLRLGYGQAVSFGDVDGDGDADQSDKGLVEASGAIGGVQLGYLYDVGRYVVGAELGLNAASIDFAAGTGGVDALHTLRLKAGIDGGDTLFYGTLGAAHAGGTFQGADFTEIGWTAGLGVEYRVSDSVSIGGEISHHRFDDLNNSGVALGLTTVSLGINYRF